MMYTRILVPLDGSKDAERALPYAEYLAKGLSAPVELFRVVDHLPPEWMDWAVGVQSLRIASSRSSHAQDYLDKAEASLGYRGLTVSSRLGDGDPASRIESETARVPGTLVAMSTHGRSGVGRWVLGSVAAKVLESSAGPLLMVRSKSQEASRIEVGLETVIVPLDGSGAAEQVLPHAAMLSRALGLKLILVRAVLPTEDTYRAMGIPVAPYGDLSRDVDVQSRRYFDDVSESLAGLGVNQVEVKFLRGHPVEAIADFSAKSPNGLIAMTSHGRSGVGRWVLGSVVERVIRSCENPMLLVRAVQNNDQ